MHGLKNLLILNVHYVKKKYDFYIREYMTDDLMKLIADYDNKDDYVSSFIELILGKDNIVRDEFIVLLETDKLIHLNSIIEIMIENNQIKKFINLLIINKYFDVNTLNKILSLLMG